MQNNHSVSVMKGGLALLVYAKKRKQTYQNSEIVHHLQYPPSSFHGLAIDLSCCDAMLEVKLDTESRCTTTKHGVIFVLLLTSKHPSARIV